MRARCIKSRFNRVAYDVTARSEYEILGIECGDFRVLGDDGQPFLYPRQLFRVIDPARPRQWVRKVVDGAEYAYAATLSKPGFFEDYFDGVRGARRTFHRYLNQHLRLTPAA